MRRPVLLVALLYAAAQVFARRRAWDGALKLSGPTCAQGMAEMCKCPPSLRHADPGLCHAIVDECQASFCAQGCLDRGWGVQVSLDCSIVPLWRECEAANEELRQGAGAAIAASFKAWACSTSSVLGCCAPESHEPRELAHEASVSVALSGPLAGLPVRRLPLGACSFREEAPPFKRQVVTPKLYADSRQEAEALSLLQRGAGDSVCQSCLSSVQARVFADAEMCQLRPEAGPAEEALGEEASDSAGFAPPAAVVGGRGERGNQVERCQYVAGLVRRSHVELSDALARGACSCMGCCGDKCFSGGWASGSRFQSVPDDQWDSSGFGDAVLGRTKGRGEVAGQTWLDRIAQAASREAARVVTSSLHEWEDA
jgi:hypothetical protein